MTEEADAIIVLMNALTEDQRYEIINTFCWGCGSVDLRCQCQNDD